MTTDANVVFTIEGGEESFDFTLDTSEDAPIQALAQSRADEAMPRPVWHTGEGMDGNELVDSTYDDARWPVVVRIGQSRE